MLLRNTAGVIEASMVVISTGAGLTAGTVYAYVRRQSDDKWLYADTTWNASKPTTTDIPTMTHVSGGLWELDHTPADAEDAYLVNCIDSGATCYPDNYQVPVLSPATEVDGISAAGAMKAILAVCAGRARGAGTKTLSYRDQADTKDVVVVQSDELGNRKSVTLDLS